MKKTIKMLVVFSCAFIFILTFSSCSKSPKIKDTNDSIADITGTDNHDSINTTDKEYLVGGENIDIKKEYRASKDDGSLSYIKDYDTVLSLCKDAQSEFVRSVSNDNEPDFNSYIANPILDEYMQYRVKNHPFNYPHGEKYKFLLKSIDFLDDCFLIESVLATYTNNSESMEGTTYFLVKNVDGDLSIAEWYWESKESIDTTLRGAFDKEDGLSFWEDEEKHGALMDSIRE